MGSEGISASRAREVVALLANASLEELPSLLARYGDDPRRQVQDAVARAKRRAARETQERERVTRMYERMRAEGGDGLVLGIDEVGRGAIAGPLTVAAVALPNTPPIWGLNDSKQLTAAKREAVAAEVRRRAVALGLAHVEPSVIDEVGMARALRMAMSEAIEATGVEPDAVLIDGNPVHVHPMERCIVQGDAKIACIAAASIVAKVTRDALMVELDAQYPAYGWAGCKGYGSAAHIAAIREHGLSPLHRVTFCGNFMDQPTLF